MKYYKLMYDYERDNEFISCTKGYIGDMDEYIVGNGEKIEKWEGNVEFAYDSNAEGVLPDYLGNPYRWLIVSSKFQEITRPFISNDVQYLPTLIKNYNGDIEKLNYQVANVVTVIEAIDFSKSIYDYFELDNERILSIEKYAIKENCVKGYHIFKLKEDTLPTFVSEQIKMLIEENNMLGFAFLEVELS